MRQYLAMQAMESGKSLGANFMGRGGLNSYGGSMLLGGDQGPQGKVGMLYTSPCKKCDPGLLFSHPPFDLSVVECGIVEKNWAKHDGSYHLLLA
jgi:hypothetical protein